MSRKSEIAIEYCYRLKDRYPEGSVFCIPADTRLKFDQAFYEIAEMLGLKKWDDPGVDISRLVVDRLTRNTAGSFVMVLDNADDLDIFTSPKDTIGLELTRLIPKSSHGQIIITTRDNHVGQVLTNWRSPISVDLMCPLDAQLLLVSSISGSEDAGEKEVLEVLRILDFLPLAITQATAYINRNNISLRQYLIDLAESEFSLQILLNENHFDSRGGFDSAVQT